MVRSKLPNEILALGDRIVLELGLEESSNTTARWMAHHLAELISRAKTLTGAKQRQATSGAADLILKLWQKREVVPGNVYPLKDLGKALSMLRLLDLAGSPFNRFSQHESDVLLTNTFDGLRKIVAYGILLNLPKHNENMNYDARTPFLLDEEKRVIEAMNLWIGHFKQARGARSPRMTIKDDPLDAANIAEADQQTEDAVAKRTFISEIDSLVVTLSKLKERTEVDC